MGLDASAQNILDYLAQAGGKPLEESTPAEARAAMANLAMAAGQGADVASVEERRVGGVDALVVTPHGEGPFPVLVWIHGGGWVLGSARESIATARNLASKAGRVVVSLDYRLAPEHQAPAAFEDCVAALGAVLDDPGSVGGRGSVAVGGDSAGGNLAALCALHFGPRLGAQLLVYPSCDLSMAHPSIDANGEGYLLTKAGMEWFRKHYLDGTGLERTDPRLSPMANSDEVLAASAPAMVITAGYDPLRDEGQAYAARLRSLGVEVHDRCFEGQIHAFFSMPEVMPEAVEAEDLAAAFLRAHAGA